MKRIITPALILLFLFSSCQKELSEEDLATYINNAGGTSSGTAVFSLEGAPGECTAPAISGIYVAGTVLDVSNTVTIFINVTAVGTYNISTAVVNGISFSGSGTFSSTGRQQVTLNGSGTPSVRGSFIYKPGNIACSFPLTVLETAPGPVNAEGVPDCTLAWSDGSFVHAVAMDSSNKIHIPVNITSAGAYFIETDPINGVVFSASGNFDVGNRVIDLSCEGTPLSAGPFLLTVNFGTNSCGLYITYQ